MRAGQPQPVVKGARSRLWQGVLQILVSASLFAACTPGRPLPWLVWVAMIPFFTALRDQKSLHGCWLAGLFGWMIFVSTAWWLYAPLHDITALSIPAAIMVVAGAGVLMAFPYSLAGFITALLPHRHGFRGAARDAAVFTVAIHWLTPVFQGNPAHALYQYPVVFQIVELGGTPLLLFLVLLVNGLLAESVARWRTARNLAWKPAAQATIIVAILLAYGFIRLTQVDLAMAKASPEQWVTVGAIQPNIPIPVARGEETLPWTETNDFFSSIAQAGELMLKHPETDILVFPENPATFNFNTDSARRKALGKLIKDVNRPIILNADAVDPAGDTGRAPARYNVAIWMDANRNLAGSYAKMRRIPIVEYLPGENTLPWLRSVFPRSQRVLTGSGPAVFQPKPNIHVIPLICYEGTLSSFARQFVRRGGNVIVNQVNDSWFLQTSASEVHLALTIYRSVEYRVPLVRVTNSGVGAHVQADGRIVPGSRTRLFEKTATAFPLYVPTHRSVYTWVGDLWMLAFAPLILPPFGRKKSA